MSDPRLGRLHAVHRLILALGRQSEVQQLFAEDPGAVFRAFGLTPEEIDALKEGTMASLARIGVHPVLRMHWLLMSNPEAAAQMSVAEYLPKFAAGAAHG